MTTINPNKCFEQVPLQVSEVGEVEDNWLELLNTLILERSQHLEPMARQELTTYLYQHAGHASTYALKKELHEALQIVYKKLKNPALSNDEKAVIYEKLVEGIGNCTPGFHDRVNEIVLGFIPTRTIDELLSRLRQTIVANIAIKSTNDVHTYNRFFVVAQRLGYGVRPMNPDDIYTGNFPDYEIAGLLRVAFLNNLTLFDVAIEIEEELRRVLTTTLGYVGICDRYTSPQYAKFLDYVKPFTDIEGGELFIMNEDMSEVQGINFNNLRAAIINKLINDEYFICTQCEKLNFQILTDGKLSEATLIPFNISRLLGDPKRLELIIKFYGDVNKEQYKFLVEMYLNSSASISDKISFIERMPNDSAYDFIVASNMTSLFESMDTVQAVRLVRACPSLLKILSDDDKRSIFRVFAYKDASLFKTYTDNIELFIRYYAYIPTDIRHSLLLKHGEKPEQILKIFKLLETEDRINLLTSNVLDRMSTEDQKKLFDILHEGLTPAEVIKLHTTYNYDGMTILQSFSSKFISMSLLLKYIPKQNRYTLLTYPTKSAHTNKELTAITAAAYFQSAFSMYALMLRKIHPTDRFSLLQSKVRDKTVAEIIACETNKTGYDEVFIDNSPENKFTESHVRLFKLILAELDVCSKDRKISIRKLLDDVGNAISKDQIISIVQAFCNNNWYTVNGKLSRNLVLLLSLPAPMPAPLPAPVAAPNPPVPAPLPKKSIQINLNSPKFLKSILDANHEYLRQEVTNKQGRFFGRITKPKHKQDFMNLVAQANDTLQVCNTESNDKDAVRQMLNLVCDELDKQMKKLEPKSKCVRRNVEQKFANLLNYKSKKHHYSRLLVTLLQQAHNNNLFEYSDVPKQYSPILNVNSILNLVDLRCAYPGLTKPTYTRPRRFN